MLTKMQIIMSNNVDPTLLRPVLRIVLAIDSVSLKIKQFMSWLQSGCHIVSFFPCLAVTLSVKQLSNIYQLLKL